MPSGRLPIELTEKLVAAICASIREGDPPETACELQGIHRSTYYLWQQKAKLGDARYTIFFDAVTRARADAAKFVRNAMLRGFEKEPKLALEWLKRREQRLWEPPKPTEESIAREDARFGETAPGNLEAQVLRLEAILQDKKARLAEIKGDGDEGDTRPEGQVYGPEKRGE